MNKDEALKMAIEALSQDEGWFEPEAAIKACKEALAQPAQEPVGNWKSKCKCDLRTKLVGDGCRYCNTEEYIDRLHADYNELLDENEQLLATPAPSWQGLSDNKIISLYAFYGSDTEEAMLEFARAIEQALKEKNS